LIIAKKSLLARIVIYFFLLSLSIVALLGTASYLFIIKDAKQAVLEKISAHATIKAEAIDRWVEEQARKAAFLSSLPELRRWSELLLGAGSRASQYGEAPASLRSFLQQVLEHTPEFQEVLLLSREGGRVAVSTNRSNEGQYRVLDTYFVEGLEETYIQNTYPSPVDLQPTLTISTPLYGAGGELLGVLAVHLDLENMDRIVQESVGLGKTGEAYLVDRYNVFVSAARFGREDYPRGVHSKGIDAAVSGKDGTGVYPNYRGIPVLGVYRWLEDRELALLVEVHEVEAYASARRQTAVLAGSGLGLVLLLAAGVYLLSRRIADPILAVQQAALQISSGNLDIHVPAPTQDEIGVLASSFNRMTVKLKRLYEELSQREEHFRALIESSLDIVAILDGESKLGFVSPSVTNMLGYRPDELVETAPLELIHPEDRTGIKEVFQVLIKEGRIPEERIEFRCRHKEGGWRLLEVTGRNLLDHPAIGGIVINVRDISERRQLEERLIQAQKMEAVGRLAGGIAHDFNNLLTAIIGYAQLLQLRFGADGAPLEQVAEIRKAAERAASLTRQLLAYSRKQLLQPKVLDLNSLIQDMQGMLRRLIGEDIELVVHPDPELRKLKADPGQLQQVILNLAINARDAMPRGGTITVTTRNLPGGVDGLPEGVEPADGIDGSAVAVEPAAHGYVLLSICDTGAGMDEATLKKIFDPFFTTKEIGKGTGLGLSSVLGIVEQSGGRITVSSQVGLGTRFSIYLPAACPEPDRPKEAESKGEMQGSESILVVEDEESVRRMVVAVLRSYGYRVQEAADAEEALAVARECESIDLLITDMVMPGKSGVELAEQLIQHSNGLKVLCISGYSEEIATHLDGVNEAPAFLSKPFTPQALVHLVREILDGR
jgi:PAS domain S-box-containing protein